jgi:hypothetical protein
LHSAELKCYSLVFTSSSNSILIDGVQSSSICPDLTDHKKATRKLPATSTLTIIKIKKTLIKRFWTNLLAIEKRIYDLNQSGK